MNQKEFLEAYERHLRWYIQNLFKEDVKAIHVMRRIETQNCPFSCGFCKFDGTTEVDCADECTQDEYYDECTQDEYYDTADYYIDYNLSTSLKIKMKKITRKVFLEMRQ